ncbi:MAG: hypothetical protein RR382_08165 [Tannerellaceae bacterium]
MKLKVKATGKIVDVELITDNHDYSIYDKVYLDPKNCVTYSECELEGLLPIDKQVVDWDTKLIELSGMAMQGIISSKRYYTVDTKYCISTYTYMENSRVASLSVSIAKELIKKLKEELK